LGWFPSLTLCPLSLLLPLLLLSFIPIPSSLLQYPYRYRDYSLVCPFHSLLPPPICPHFNFAIFSRTTPTIIQPTVAGSPTVAPITGQPNNCN
jgi:hypothetical protein